MSDLDVSGDIICGEYPDDSGNLRCGIRIYGEHTGSWVFASDCHCKEHAVNVDVIRVDRLAGCLIKDIDTRHTHADLPVLVIGYALAVTQHLCSQLDGLYDFHIACAAADVVADCVAYLILCWLRILIQKPLCAHYHARGAESALDRTCLAECSGEDVLLFL